jgi:hypothetical protein
MAHMKQEPQGRGFRPTMPPTTDNIRENTLELLRHLYPDALFQYTGKGTGASRVHVRAADGISFHVGTGLAVRKGDIQVGSLKYLDLATLERVQAFVQSAVADAARLVQPPAQVKDLVRKHLGREIRSIRSRDGLQWAFDYGATRVLVSSRRVTLVETRRDRTLFTADYADPSELDTVLMNLSRASPLRT